MNLDTLLFIIVSFKNWVAGDGLPLAASMVLGVYGFVTLMLEVFKKPSPPVWTWGVGYAISAIWLWWFWGIDEALVAAYGYWSAQVGHVIISAMVAFVAPFVTAIPLALVFFMLPVMAIEFVKDPSIFFGRRETYYNHRRFERW